MTILPVPRTAIIVVAAGSGTRLGARAPKAFVGIDARPILRHALDGVFAAAPAQVIVVAPEGWEGDAETELREAAGERADLGRVVVGGATRQQSVAAGLAALWGDVETVLVHDAARALTPPTQIDAVAASVTADVGVIPALPVVDTLKKVVDGVVVAAVDRSELAAAQTPQGFPRTLLESAYAAARDGGTEYTDDAALFAAAGHPVRYIGGSERAFKITTPADLERARHLLGTRAAASGIPRVGIGTDVHAFGGEGNLWLAGLEWEGSSRCPVIRTETPSLTRWSTRSSGPRVSATSGSTSAPRTPSTPARTPTSSSPAPASSLLEPDSTSATSRCSSRAIGRVSALDGQRPRAFCPLSSVPR